MFLGDSAASASRAAGDKPRRGGLAMTTSNCEPAAASARLTEATSPVTTSTDKRWACAARKASDAAGGYDSTKVVT